MTTTTTNTLAEALRNGIAAVQTLIALQPLHYGERHPARLELLQKEAAIRQALADYEAQAEAKPAPAEPMPAKVWEASDKTSSMLFASQECGKRWLSQFPASVGGGFELFERTVYRLAAAPAAPAPLTDAELDALMSPERYAKVTLGNGQTVGPLWSQFGLRQSMRAAIAASKEETNG